MRAPEEHDHIPHLWAETAGRNFDRVAVLYEGQAITYGELDRLIRSFAGALRGPLGLQPGDRLALLMPNSLPSLVCYLGALWAGVIALPLNIRLKAPELRFMLEDAGARAVVVHQSLWATLQEAAEGLPALQHRVGIGVQAEGVVDYGELLDEATPLPQPHPAARDEVAAIIYTSGTTGLPKGAMITHGNVLFNIAATLAGHGFEPTDRHLLIVPLFHVTGLNTIMPTAFYQGASVVVSAQTAPSEILDLIERHGITTFFAVPTTMILLAQHPGVESRPLPTLRLLAYSGAPMPVRTIERLRELYPDKRLHNFFGLTETTSCTSVLPSEQALVRPESIGRVVPGLAAKIVNEAGETLPAGEVGELLLCGPSIVKGYYNRPEATAEAIVDGWLHTGDTARMDDEGYIFLQGRQKEMIIVAGENVYPVEVENVLTRHPAVAEAAAIGQPHAIFGEVVKAVVVRRPGQEATGRELKRWCTEQLAGYKVPQVFEFREALPRNPSGKVVKRELRE